MIHSYIDFFFLSFTDHSINKENNNSRAIRDDSLAINSPPISSQLQDLSNSLKMLYSSTPSCMQIPKTEPIPLDIVEPKTPTIEQNMSINRWDAMNAKSPWETFSMRGSGMKVWSIHNIAKWLHLVCPLLFLTYNLFELQSSLVQEYLRFLNTANK